MVLYILKTFYPFEFFEKGGGHQEMAPKGVLKKIKMGLKNTFPLTYVEKISTLSFLKLFFFFKNTPFDFDFIFILAP